MNESDSGMFGGAVAALSTPVVALPAGGLALFGILVKSPMLVLAAFAWLAPTALVAICHPPFWQWVNTRRRCRLPDLPSTLDLSDDTAALGLQRLRRTRRLRQCICAELRHLAALIGDPRLREALADLERGCVALILALDRIGRAQQERSDARGGLLWDPLETSKADLARRLAELLTLLEQVGPWLLRLDAEDQATRAEQLRPSMETLAAVLESQQSIAPAPERV